MAESRDGTAADLALDRFWDGVAASSDRPTAPPNRVDPAAAATVRRFHALPDAPPPSPAFVARLEEKLMRPHAIPATARPIRSGAANGTTRDGWTSPSAPSARYPRRRIWWRALEGLAAAALVLAIAAGLLTGWGLLPGRSGKEGTAVPAIANATPGPAVVDGAAMFLGNAARTGEVAGPGPSAKPDERWRVPIAAGEVNVTPSAPVAFDGLVYVPAIVSPLTANPNQAASVFAFDVATGTERWRTEVFDAKAYEYPEVSPAAVANGLLFVGVSATHYREPAVSGTGGANEVPIVTGSLVALDARSGVERWHAPTGGSGASAPAVVDDAVYVGSADGSVRAFDAATGVERWRWPVDTAEGEQLRLGGVISPVVANGLVYAPVYALDGVTTLYALDGRTGQERWRFAPEGGIWGQPIVAGDTAFVGSSSFPDQGEGESTGRLYALDAQTGSARWRRGYDGGNVVDFHAAVGGGTVYLAGIGDDDREVLALDAASGRERWRVGFDGTVEVAPVLVGDAVYVASGDNGLFGSGQTWLGAGTHMDALDTASGERRWRVGLGVGPAFLPAVDGAAVYGISLPGYGGSGAFLTAFGSSD